MTKSTNNNLTGTVTSMQKPTLVATNDGQDEREIAG